ncbi:MAG: hypothetical protein OJF59_001785 [Cytophagales bacterium]|jgi:hypothetical protein|nr:hypothetical protein [Bacteroidota bacterium]MBS1950741.1 hypothetical protein [Bacteroidota bacterium]MBS1980699.1 hypothetical protein [Bacteroidota bacterium]WHZ08032.1 MAG: hypothetical protein OJF59_001785 [Cytophagales bacterium]
MKTIKIVLGIALASAIASCSMNQSVRPDLSSQITGTYKGALTSSLSQTSIAAIAEITSVNNNNIQVHCYGADLDTTLSLGLYPDGNMMRVCLTGNDFENQYGHNMSANNQMMGSSNQMMENMSNGTSWQQHMSAEHKPGDPHYGYFDMNAKTFSYTFNFMSAQKSYTRQFAGKR